MSELSIIIERIERDGLLSQDLINQLKLAASKYELN